MKRLLALLMALALLPCAGFAEEEVFAVEEEFAFTEEEPVAILAEETVEALEEYILPEEETMSVEELQPEEAIEELEEPVEPEEVCIEESLEEVQASGTWGTCRWEIDDDGVLTIHAGTGADTNGRCPWERYTEEITAVVAAEKIILPADVSRLFCDCGSMTTMDVSGFNTGSVENMFAMFAWCISLTTLDVSGFDTGYVIDMYSMFAHCSSLAALDLSGFDTGSVESMHTMFYECSSLTALNLSGFDTSGADMAWMFDRCNRLASVTLGSGFSFKGDEGGVLTTLPARTMWTSGATGKMYTAEEIAENRSGIADTYTALDGIASGLWGTCLWEIDDDGVLTIHAGTGATNSRISPWDSYAEVITAVVATEEVVLPENASSLFCLFFGMTRSTNSEAAAFPWISQGLIPAVSQTWAKCSKTAVR